MAGLTTAGLQRDGVLRELAELYADADRTEMLLRRLGADMSRLPPAGTQAPANRWFRICLTIEHGAFPFTLEELLAAARREFPGNAVLRGSSGDAAPEDEVTVLCLLAGPARASRLQLREEHRTIQEAARRGRARALRVEVSAATRPRDVIPALTEHRPDVLHFGGHGSARGELLLEADDGSAAPVSAKALAGVLEAVGGVRVVVLNACHLGRYLEAIAPYTGEVIGCAERLEDGDALAFCRDYYAALSLGESWESAFKQGRAGVGLTRPGLPDLRREVRVREGGAV
ncbi:effector-associated domain EAD1-containing protein [Streptomyces sp. NPDC090106]|uniref:effector-associated domain EAD1-containing protein n=1 Tax=Streptomyces sp. NPDC090106 TaxID=3365946 RepID=UPI003801F0FD